ncbi:MAG TPA: ATP-binding cassette domain-containing protein, partial [Burkholderiaceae bacterium]|nr:ATP-binding cassette domain-containing protein [Burkholderiaceae bacterium]
MSNVTLLTLANAELAFGNLPLLDSASLSMTDGERIGLIGRNGSGKSSLLAVIAGQAALDDGELRLRDGARIAAVEQEPVLPEAATLGESLAARGALSAIGDDRERWAATARIAEWLQRFGVAADAAPAALSGGERKRAALALAFALAPDLMLLDEPTNHLDIEGIERLEESLLRVPAAVVVTHDRWFLDRIATRIVELDRGLLRSYPGNFAAYERRKADELATEAQAARRFDKFWAQEEAWIRKGVEARRTRNEGRVRRLEQLRAERERRRERSGTMRLTIDAGERSGKRVAELVGVSKRFGDRILVRDLDLTVLRGDRIGLIGPNGAGKSTLLRLILGTLPPDTGSVRLGTNLQVAYFDQMREQLDPERTVAETISPGSDWIELEGGRKHVISYLADFLFPARAAQSPIRMLSGGERNRLLLARLFARSANLIVLDEPTNDLDLESIELLEQTLQSYSGTLLLVSHDRTFLDNVVTQTLVAEGDGRWREYVGGYRDWLAQRAAAPAPAAGAAAARAGERRAPPAPAAAARERSRDKLSYREQR